MSCFILSSMNYRELQFKQLIKKDYLPKLQLAQDLGITDLNYQDILTKLQGRTILEVLAEVIKL